MTQQQSGSHTNAGHTIRKRTFTRLTQLFLSGIWALSATMTFAQTHNSTAVVEGYRDFSYGSAYEKPTSEKPEHKLWIVDNIWYGSMWDESSSTYSIHRYDKSGPSWTNVGPGIDDRANSLADALWDGNKLYIASHMRTGSGAARLYRYSYDGGSQTFSLDAGFPVDVNDEDSETLTITKDSTGKLWITWTSGGQVMVNCSITGDDDWESDPGQPDGPFELPVTDSDASSDDISAIVSFGGDKIGILWSNQGEEAMLFAAHRDDDPRDSWQAKELAFFDAGLGAVADDHINMKVTADNGGNVYAVTKTSLEGGSDPVVTLLKRDSSGNWEWHQVWDVDDDHSRPILLIDEENRDLYVFAPSLTGSPRTIYMKSTSMDNINFPSGIGTTFIRSNSDDVVNDPTSTRQNVNGATGILVLASAEDTRHYLHNYIELSSSSPPDAPTSLSATTQSSSQINLAWTDNSSNESGFKIERHSGDGNFSEIADVAAGVESYNDTGLSSSTTYTYRVYAYNGSGDSGFSNEASATTDAPPPPPAAPSALTATANGSSQIDLAWTDNANNEDEFKIERHDGDGNFVQIATVSADVTSYNDTGLSASTTYTYRVRASNGSGDSGYSNEASATTDDPPPPPADPSGLTATANGHNQIDLAWNDNSGNEDEFRIERHDGDGNFTEIATVGADVTSYNDTGLDALTTYTYRVFAVNGSGSSGYSNEASATTDEAPPVTCSPGENLTSGKVLTASSVEVEDGPIPNANDGDLETYWESADVDEGVPEWLHVDLEEIFDVDSISVAWESKNYATVYEIQTSQDDVNWTTAVSATKDDKGTDVFSFPAVAARYVRVHMTEYKKSSVKIAEFEVFGCSDGGSPQPPADPSGLTATANGTAQIDLAWTDNSGNEDNFKIERHAGDGNFAEIATVGADVTSFGDTGLSASTTYTYRVRAANAAGNSGYSNEASATTDDPPQPPADPSGLTATANGASQIDLAWTDNSSNEDNFKIERHAGDGNFAEIATVGADVTSFGDTGLSVSTTYTYRVRAVNGAGNSGYSNEASATTDDPPSPPADPSGLTATANGTSQIDLSWTDNASNEDNFKIERHAGDGNFAEIATVGADVTSFGDTGLAASTTYTYRVRASNAAGNSGYSNEASATTDDPPPPPADPSGLTATANGSSQIDLAWTDNASDEDNFVIERHAGDGNFAEIATVGADVTSFGDTGLLASTTYTYRIFASNGAGDSGYSNEAFATTDDAPPVDCLPGDNHVIGKLLTASSVEEEDGPIANANDGDQETFWKSGDTEDGIPEWLHVDLEEIFEVDSVTVAWESKNYATVYEIQTSLDDLNWTAVVNATKDDKGTDAFSFAAVSARYVRVYMLEFKKSSLKINEFEVFGCPDQPATPPSAPSGLTATANGSSQIDLAWSDNANNETGFKIERHAGDGNFAQIASVGANATNYSNGGLSAATTYTYRVRATNGAGDSGYSNAASATTDAPPPPPAAPSGLTATANGSAQIDLSWTDNSGNEDNFKIERHAGDGNFAEIATVGADVVSYNDTGLSASTTYTYRVRAANAAGNSGYSNEASATTDDPPPPPADPSGLTATTNGSSQIDLSWTDNSSNEDNFKIERHAGDGNFAEIATVGTDVTSYDDTGLSANTTYTYRVRASNGAGDSGYSNEASATTDEGGADPNVNLALDKPIAASNVFSSFVAENANDGDEGTSWGTKDEGNEEWLRVDLEASQTIGRAIIKWSGSRFAPDYELQVSDDEVNWTTVYATDAGAEGEQEFEFAQTTARYVRLYVLSFNSGAVAVMELEVYAGPATAKRRAQNAVVEALPTEFALHQNYPNPFNPATRISFSLPQAEQVTIKVFSLLGAEIATIVNARFEAGVHSLKFDAGRLAGGVYIYQLQAGSFTETKRMLLIK